MHALLQALAAVDGALRVLNRAPSGDEEFEWRLAVERHGSVKKERGIVTGKLAAVLAVVSALRKLRLQGYQVQAAVLIPTINGVRDPERQREAIDLDLLSQDQRTIQLRLATGKGMRPLAA